MEGFLLTRLGTSLVYLVAAWQGYLGTSVGVLFDLFGLLASGERPWKGFLLTCLSQCAGCPWAGLDFWFLFELFGCQGCLGGDFLKAVTVTGLFGYLCRVSFWSGVQGFKKYRWVGKFFFSELFPGYRVSIGTASGV